MYLQVLHLVVASHVILVHVNKIRMNKKTKTILIISFILLFVGVCAGIFLLVTRPPKTYPKEPINQESLQYTSQKINLTTEYLNSKDYPLYGVSSTVMLKEVESFVSQAGSNLKKVTAQEGIYYEWSLKNDSVIYRLNQNSVMFSFEKGISWDEADISAYTFKAFAKKYFGKDWEYKLSQNEILPNGKTIYYANRMLGESMIETNEYRQETDYLIFESGKISEGKILLTEFFDTEKTLPSLNSRNLIKYINLENYPKEIYPNYSTLADSVLKEVNYLSDDFEKVTDSISSCAGDAVEVVYLYKNFNQESLTPVYKISLQCEVTYKDTKYTIPAIGYVNAVEPKYISIPE